MTSGVVGSAGIRLHCPPAAAAMDGVGAPGQGHRPRRAATRTATAAVAAGGARLRGRPRPAGGDGGPPLRLPPPRPAASSSTSSWSGWSSATRSSCDGRLERPRRRCRSRTCCCRSSRSSELTDTDRIDAAVVLATHAVAPGRAPADPRGDRRRLRRRRAGRRLGLPPRRHRQPRPVRGTARRPTAPARSSPPGSPPLLADDRGTRPSRCVADARPGGRADAVVAGRRRARGHVLMAPLRRRQATAGGRAPARRRCSSPPTCTARRSASASSSRPPAFYGADLLVLGGDLTGKLVIPLVDRGDGRTRPELHGRRAAARRRRLGRRSSARLGRPGHLHGPHDRRGARRARARPRTRSTSCSAS